MQLSKILLHFKQLTLPSLGVTKNYGKIMFIVKRHPFKRLFSGFRDKILQSYRGSYHDKMSQKILEKYRGLPRKKYKHKKTVPTFGEFIEYVLDLYEKTGEIDMHWAPVVNFCSVCKVSQKILRFDFLVQGI